MSKDFHLSTRFGRSFGWVAVHRGLVVLQSICILGVSLLIQGCSPTNQPSKQSAQPNQSAATSSKDSAQSTLRGVQAGVHAYDSGDYATALARLKPLANAGQPLAQVFLGLMYYEGRAVAQDYAQAFEWNNRAADQGEPMAQLGLGVLYGAGQGVQKDLVQAYMRFSLCLDDPGVGADCRKHRDLTASQMTQAEIAEGQRLATNWKSQKSKQ
jgi:uncharacterized protein